MAALQIDSVGRIVAAGTESNNSGTEGILWRYNADGSLDTTLGGGDGYVITGDNSVLNNPVGTAGGVGWQADDEFYSLQIDSSGRYVVAGISDDASGNDDLVIWRYNTDGSLDTTLSGGTGYVLAGPSVASWGACGKYCNEKTGSLQIDSSHRYVIASLYTNPSGGIEGGIWRFNSDGSVDTTFGGGAGYVLTGTTGAALASGASENDVFSSLQMDSSNRLVIVGYSVNTSGGTELAIWRFNTDGSADASFGGGTGYVLSGSTGAAGGSGAGEFDAGSSFQIDSENRYVIAGVSASSLGIVEAAVWRCDSNGALDTSFGGGTGYVLSMDAAGAGGWDNPYVLQIDPQGRYVTAGYSTNSSGGGEATIWRYLSNGALDQ